jgi:hypothetical protein
MYSVAIALPLKANSSLALSLALVSLMQVHGRER